jgi:hypothetical protein
MESRTSLGRSALSSGAVLHDRVTGLYCVGMAIEEYGTAYQCQRVSLRSTQTESCVARYSGTTL